MNSRLNLYATYTCVMHFNWFIFF